jgi:cell division protein FtsN
MPKMRNVLIILVVIMTGMNFLYWQPVATAANDALTSYAPQIAQYVKEDKVYLLEKIRRQITKPSEKLLVQALLSEDGPEAAGLYRKQLSEHPDPAVDPISQARLEAYEQAVTTTPDLPVMPRRKSALPAFPDTTQQKKASPLALPSGKPDSSTGRRTALPAVTRETPAVTKTIPAKKADSTLPVQKLQPVKAAVQPATGNFTLQFGSFDNAANATQLCNQISQTAPASVQNINSIYKVRLKRTFTTRQEATAFARTLPVESFVVPLQP